MAICNGLADAGRKLEIAVTTYPDPPSSNAELYDRYEEIAIQILDSQSDHYLPGALEEYLQAVLYVKQLELAMVEFPEPSEC